MSPMLMFASLAITGALALYTIGVFKERADGNLRRSHVVLFWLGQAFIRRTRSERPIPSIRQEAHHEIPERS